MTSIAALVLPEEINVDRVRSHGNDSRVAPAITTRPEVDATQQIVHLCGELAGRDEKTLNVALDGINNNLTKAENLDETDKVAIMVEECGGLNRIQQLKHHKRPDLPQVFEYYGNIFP